MKSYDQVCACIGNDNYTLTYLTVIVRPGQISEKLDYEKSAF